MRRARRAGWFVCVVCVCGGGLQVNGPNTNAVYQELKRAFPGDIAWNFGKVLLWIDISLY